jgi:hypothetical protein
MHYILVVTNELHLQSKLFSRVEQTLNQNQLHFRSKLFSRVEQTLNPEPASLQV